MTEAITILSTKLLRPDIHELALQEGMTLIEYDFISASYIVNEDVADQLRRSDPYIVFTSQHAVKSAIANVQQFNISFNAKKVFSLKGETLTACSALHGINVIGSAAKARDLANVIMEHREIKKLSFICGDKRLDILPGILKDNSIALDEIIVYSTRLIGGIVKSAYHGILFFSPSAVESFFQTNVLAKNIICFCIGDTTATAVRQHTGNIILKADDMTQESMLHTAQKYFHTKKYKTS